MVIICVKTVIDNIACKYHFADGLVNKMIHNISHVSITFISISYFADRFGTQ